MRRISTGGDRADRAKRTRLDEAAVCGLYCPSCSVFLASAEDPAWLARLAERNGVSPEEERCRGCRSEERSYHCEACTMAACAASKGIAFCSDCEAFPCAEVVAWQAVMPHRVEVFDWLRQVRVHGVDPWACERRADFTCPVCGTVNSAYNLRCRRCGSSPSCRFVERHAAALLEFIGRAAG